VANGSLWHNSLQSDALSVFMLARVHVCVSRAFQYSSSTHLNTCYALGNFVFNYCECHDRMCTFQLHNVTIMQTVVRVCDMQLLNLADA
jgi:hypothetical protein